MLMNNRQILLCLLILLASNTVAAKAKDKAETKIDCTQTLSGEKNKAYCAGGNITIGLTEDQYEKNLKKQEDRLVKRLLEARNAPDHNKKQIQVLETELKVTQEKLANIEASYKETKKKLEAADKTLLELKDQLPEAKIDKARASLQQGNTIEAEKAFDDIVKKGSASVAIAAFQSGQLAEDRIDYFKALDQYKIALALDKNNPEYLFEAGQMANKLADYALAQKWLEQLLKIRQAENKENTDLANVLGELANVYKAQGKYDKAEPLYFRSLSIREKAQGKDHPSVATTLDNLAGLYQDQGKYNKAVPLFLRDLSIKEKALGKDHPSVATTLNNLAGLYESQGKYDKAEPLYRRSLSIKEKALGKDHPSVATTLDNLAALYYAQGKYDKAEPLYLRSLSIKEKALGKDHPSVATTLNNLAVLYYYQKKYKEAVPLLQQSLSILKKVFPGGHPRIDQYQGNLNALQAKIAR